MNYIKHYYAIALLICGLAPVFPFNNEYRAEYLIAAAIFCVAYELRYLCEKINNKED